MGKGRTTVGLVTACLIKEIQITKELRYDNLAAFQNTREISIFVLPQEDGGAEADLNRYFARPDLREV